MRISIVHTKGGVGKTTTAACLGVAATRQGRTVEVLDADPQRSLTHWRETANELGDPLPFAVRAVDALADLAAVPSGTVQIIDTPPKLDAAIQDAIDGADIVVVPTGVSPLDLDRVWPTLRITAHRPTAVLFTLLDNRTTLVNEARALLDEQGVPCFRAGIPLRAMLRSAFGTTPTKLHGYQDVWDEIAEMEDTL